MAKTEKGLTLSKSFVKYAHLGFEDLWKTSFLHKKPSLRVIINSKISIIRVNYSKR